MTTTINEAGGKAYRLKPEHALIQYAFTGTLGSTYYTSARANLDTVLGLCRSCTPELVARVAIASRDGHMKDMPAILAAHLNATDPRLLSRIFDRVIDNGKMLKKFVRIVKSGVTGRRGFGTVTKRTIRNWLDNRNDTQLLFDRIGGSGERVRDVSLEHVIRMVHPKPKTKQRSAMYAWLCGAKITDGKLVQDVRYKDKDGNLVESTRSYAITDLPDRVQQWESYKQAPVGYEHPPKVPFQMLEGMPDLTSREWEVICRHSSWQQLRQNLVQFKRNGVFDNPRMVELVCQRLRDREEIKNARVFPYQLLAAYLNTGPIPDGVGLSRNYWDALSQSMDRQGKKPVEASSIPRVIRYALEDALEVAVENVPQLKCQIFVCVDTSGSMGYPITGKRDYSRVSTKVRCVDVAGLITAAILRRNPTAEVLPFNTEVHRIPLNPMDTVMQNAKKFAKIGGGGTSCSEPLRELNRNKAKGDLVIFVSDYESWADQSPKGTALMEQWMIFKERNPEAKLACIDITPNTNAQVIESPDILLVGGFSDKVFTILKQFAEGELTQDHWLGLIDAVKF